MSFNGKQAIVTGAGSGIGAALGANARSARLDVTDAAAVQTAVDEIVDRAGRLDLIFNNAGIVWGGDTELLTLDQWNTIIDVNIRGVVHGVAAAYPLMVRQGHGHIINTASMAGLLVEWTYSERALFLQPVCALLGCLRPR
jgi:NADP-dependent 3-hydroxy acid dehydrogenase YdfG